VKLLILTQYFPPETGAPQNRLFELAIRLQKQGIDITVLTAMPNYPQMEIYEAYAGKSYVYENMEGLKVHRRSIYVSKSKAIIPRLRNYFSFVLSAITGAGKLEKQYDYILCESPPLFLGYAALYLKRVKKASLIFNVSDLWPESAEKLGVVNNKYLLALAYRLEKRLYRASVLVSGQTQGICKNIRERFPSIPTYWLPNGVDLHYYNPERYTGNDWRQKNGFGQNDFILFYGGIIGIAQGLEVILRAAEKLKSQTHIKFVLQGNGPEKPRLMALCQSLDLSNVLFLDSVSKSHMPDVLRSVNASVIPLRKLELFMGAIPSKIFESAAMQLPLILAVDGEARQLFINAGKAGLFVEPENVASLTAAVTQLAENAELCKQLGQNGRQYVEQYFNREKIAEGFIQQLKSL
jgi:glycosyltransferase involved in cell wall biosynthesis